MKLNWRDARNELPLDDRNVVVRVKIDDVKINAYDYFDNNLNDWACYPKSDDYSVIEWIDLSDIPH